MLFGVAVYDLSSTYLSRIKAIKPIAGGLGAAVKPIAAADGGWGRGLSLSRIQKDDR